MRPVAPLTTPPTHNPEPPTPHPQAGACVYYAVHTHNLQHPGLKWKYPNSAHTTTCSFWLARIDCRLPTHPVLQANVRVIHPCAADK